MTYCYYRVLLSLQSDSFQKSIEKTKQSNFHAEKDIFNDIWNTKKRPEKNSLESKYETLPVSLQSKMSNFFDIYIKKQIKKDRKHLIELEWKVISTIIDRTLFYAFILISLITSSAIFMQQINTKVNEA